MEKEVKLIGQATSDQIAAWKKMHKIDEIFELIAEGHACYLKPFDRAAMKYALSRMNLATGENGEVSIDVGKMIEIGEIGLQNGWLGGSEEIKTNDRLFVSIALQCGALFDLAEVNLKKL